MTPGRQVVLNASAVLAFLGDEPGAQEVGPVFPSAVVSSVTLAEVATKLVERGVESHRVLAGLRAAGVGVVEFTAADAMVAGELRSSTRHRGLSLGDRCCLALALRTGAPRVLTTDRAWGDLDLPLRIEVLR